MAEKLYICTKGWVRHSKGTIINDWEYKRINPESREQFFQRHTPITEAAVVEVVPEPVIAFEKDLQKNLKNAGIDAEFKHEVNDGNSEVKATFKFKNDKAKDAI